MSFADIYFKATCIFLIIVCCLGGIGLIVLGIIKAFKNKKAPLCLECKHLSQYKGPHWRYTCSRSWCGDHFDRAPKYCKYFEPIIPVDKTVTVSPDGSKTIVITQRDRY